MVLLHYYHIPIHLIIKLEMVEVVVDMVPLTQDQILVKMVDQVVVVLKDQQKEVEDQQIHLLE
tara:strand:- start:551 stop:739 length:189 start_codon:yes stop_codon:yes gene_type:complete